MEDGRGAETRAIVGAAIVKLELIRLEAHERVEDLLYVLAPLLFTHAVCAARPQRLTQDRASRSLNRLITRIANAQIVKGCERSAKLSVRARCRAAPAYHKRHVSSPPFLMDPLR